MNYEPLYTFAEKHRVPYNELCTALRAALAAPQPEPVAHLWKFASGELVVWGGDPKDGGSRVFPVYAAPPAAPAPAVPEVMAGPMPPMSEADEKRLNAALTIVFDLACGPADPTMMQDELVAAAESIGMRFPAPAVPDDIAAIIACLGDDAALLRETTDDSEEIAQNMDDAAAALERLSAAPAVPIDMVLHCPKCGVQHIDAPETDAAYQKHLSLGGFDDQWHNPPHRSHLCRPEDGGCGHIWRPADVPTNGVAAVQTKGKADSPIAAPAVPLAKSRAGSVYLAGPMTGYKNFNFPAFNAAAEMLRSEGLRVVNPADHGVVPDATWEDYLRYDIAKLAGCESIALLPGWSKSKGARLEFHISQALGMPIKLLGGAESAAPAVPDLKHKPTVQRLMDLARKFRATPGDLYDGAYKELQQACYEALSAAPVVREPLTDAQMWQLWNAQGDDAMDQTAAIKFARAIETAHGIGGDGK